MTGVAIGAAVVIVLVLGAVLVYNGVVRARNMIGDAWSGVDVQLKRRHDLVPNLVSTVQAYAAHESPVLQDVASARAGAEVATDAASATPAEATLGTSLRDLLAVAEGYPDLKASQNFLQLQAELTSVENEIAAARAIYNGNVRAYNSRIESFPAALLAGTFGWKPEAFFAADDADRVVPQATTA